MEGRRWSDGLHQAVEAKEGIKIREENQTLATITIQNFFKLYDKLAGMTGTALTEAGEFHKIYTLDVTVVPTNRPLRRTNYDDRVFLTEKEKFTATVEEILEVYRQGRPVLVGTTSIEASERLSGILGKRGVPHEVLNAKQHEREAMIIAKAGQLGSVTVSTNMAGRGTDILLGHFEFADLIEHWQKAGLAPKSLDPEDADPLPKLIDHWVGRYLASDSDLGKKAANGDFDAKRDALAKYWRKAGLPALPFEPVVSVAQLGGLHIVGTERHESRRIDNQLRGRAGRQGDPGSSVFFVSLEDPLMRRFMREGVKKILARLGMGEGQEITSPMVTRNIEKAQKKVEERNFDIRKNLLEYDQVNDEQRRAIYGRRTAMLRGEQLEETTWELIELMLANEVPNHFPRSQAPSEWTPSELTHWLRRKFELEVDPEELRASGGAAEATEMIRAGLQAKLDEMREEFGDTDYELTLRFLLLRAFDEKWKEHLRELEALRQAVGLRGYAQQDPKVEYRREASLMFGEMEEHIADSVTDSLFKIRVTTEMDDMLGGRWQPTRLSHEEAAMFQAGGPADAGQPDANDPIGSTPERLEPIKRETPKVGRNDPCPCGSGKKYKKCCGRNES
jgi:preprotein translocase subunit SecA